ncbi:MAG: prolyl oligopeptidase family serine peptidase [Clostridia bacterium]|nr:prolyl oligopeptidase family serine peptidase [Clostridia bacterium]
MLKSKKIILVILAIMLTLPFIIFTSCTAGGESADDTPSPSAPQEQTGEFISTTLEVDTGTIHYHYYLPNGYDTETTYPMIVALPGYGGMWFGQSSLGNNLRERGVNVWAEFGDYIVVSPQLTDWGATSARQTIELTEYFIQSYSVDTSRVYAAGHSAGGETLSRVMGSRSDLFAAYLHDSSQWDGGYESAAQNRLAVYLFIAENDEYYGSSETRAAYENLVSAYKDEGITDEQVDSLIKLDIESDSYFDSKGYSNYHAGGQAAFDDENITSWILSHTK